MCCRHVGFVGVSAGFLVCRFLQCIGVCQCASI